MARLVAGTPVCSWSKRFSLPAEIVLRLDEYDHALTDDTTSPIQRAAPVSMA